MGIIKNPPVPLDTQLIKAWIFAQNPDGTFSPASFGGGGGGGNSNITGINGNPPSVGNPLPVELSDGTNPFGTFANPLGINLGQWGGTAVSAPPASGVPAVGTEVAPVVKPVQRKNNALVTTAAIGANSSFTSAWIDTQQTGDSFVALIWNITSASGLQTSSLKVQVSDDQVNIANIAFFTPTSATVGFGITKVPLRYWRFQQTIGTGGASPVYISATGSNIPSSLAPFVLSGNSIFGDGTLVNLNSGSIGDTTTASAWLNTAGSSVAALSAQYVITSGPATGANWAALRTPTTFKTVQATASGNTALWTPTTGKKFRLMRFNISIPAQCKQSVSGVLTITFQDATTGINHAYDVFVPGTADTISGVDFNSGWIDLGNGILSAAANNVLNINLSAALTAGNVRVNAAGTEE